MRSGLMLLSLVWSGAVMAQDADTFDLSGGWYDGRGTLQLAHPKIGDHGDFYAGLGLVYAKDPLVKYLGEERVPVVSTQFSTRVVGGYTIAGVARIDLEVPLYPVLVVDGTSHFSLGNIRLSSTVELLGYDESGLGIALVPLVIIPSAGRDTYLSNGPGGGLALAVGGEVGPLGLTSNVGAILSPATDLGDTKLGSKVTFGAGLSYTVVEEFLIGAEVDGALGVAGGVGGYQHPFESHLFGVYSHESGLMASLGLGTALSPGIGAPQVRALAGIGFAMGRLADGQERTKPFKEKAHFSDTPTPGDTGGDGDADGDGIPDYLDKCPDKMEDRDRFQDEDGCPDDDNDQDGVRDIFDKCPEEAEDIDTFKARSNSRGR